MAKSTAMFRCVVVFGLALAGNFFASNVFADNVIGDNVIGDSAKQSPETAKVTYEEDVKPIFREHCMTCHNQGDKRGGFALDSYGVLMEGGGSGEVVYEDGDVDSSRLWQLVNHDDTPVMPPEQSKIPAKKLDVLKAWIEGGALENSGSKAKAKPKNSLAFVAPSAGKPDGPPPMPGQLPQTVPVVTSRASAITAVAASPWAPLVAVAGQKQIVLYHSESGQLLGILPFDEGIAQSLRFSRDGRYLVAGGGEHSVRGIAAVYGIESGKRLAIVGDDLDTVFDADCNHNMSKIALGGPQKMLRIFDATDGTILFDLKKHTDWIYSVAFSPDGVLIASADRSGGLVVWEADTGRPFLDLTDHKGAVNSLSWRDDSNVLASASDDGTVKLWDMAAGKVIKSINVNGGAVTSVRFDHKGQIVTGSKDRKVRVWDSNGKLVKQIPAAKETVLEVAITHDSQRVVRGDWNGNVDLISIADPKDTHSLAANPAPIQERLKRFDQMLATIRSKLTPLIEKQNAAKNALDASVKAIADAQARLKILANQRDKTKATVASSNSKSQVKQKEVNQWVAQSQKQHVKVVALRKGVNASRAADKVEPLAAAEIQLAGLLTRIAKARRLAVQTDAKDAVLRTKLDELQAKVKPAEELVKKRREQKQEADRRWNQAKKLHDQVADELSEQEQSKANLVEAAK